MRAPERQQVVDHHRESRHLVLDRLQLRGARMRALLTAQHGCVRSDDRKRIAQVVADLRDVQAAFAIEVTQAVREPLERARTRPTSLRPDASATSRPPADFLGRKHHPELPPVATPCPLEQPDAHEHERQADRHEPFGLDQQQVAFDVLRHLAHGQHAPPADELSTTAPSSDARPTGAASSAGSPPADLPSSQASRVPATRDASCRRAGEAASSAHQAARPARHTIVDACDEEPDRGERERDHERDCDREAGLERHVARQLPSGHEPLRGGIPGPTR